jgi:hypothetical protein
MKKRHSAEQIVGLLRQADVALGDPLPKNRSGVYERIQPGEEAGKDSL